VAFIDTGIREGHSRRRKNGIACRSTEAISEMAALPKAGVRMMPDWYACWSLVDTARK